MSYQAGDTIALNAIVLDENNAIQTDLTATIDVFLAGVKIVDAAAITPDLKGWYVYSYASAVVGFYNYNVTFSDGRTASGDVQVLDDAAITDAIKNNTDAILADTNELQQNQDNFLTATGFSTNADMATLLGRITEARAAFLDNLDELISSRLAAVDYTAPPSIDALALEATLTAASAVIINDIANLKDFDPATQEVLTGKIELDAIPYYDLLDAYVPERLPGTIPGVPVPPADSNLINVWMYCFKLDNPDVWLESITSSASLPAFTISNNKGFEKVGVWTYDNETGLAEITVPENIKLSITIQELGLSKTGYAYNDGTGLIRADLLLDELPV